MLTFHGELVGQVRVNGWPLMIESRRAGEIKSGKEMGMEAYGDGRVVGRVGPFFSAGRRDAH